MKKGTITGVIVLMGISLIGIILVQLFWMKNAIEVKEKQFDQAVQDVLAQTVNDLARGQKVSWVSEKIWKDPDTLVKIVNQKKDSGRTFNIKSTTAVSNNNSVSVISNGEEQIIEVDDLAEGNIIISRKSGKNQFTYTLNKLDSLKYDLSEEAFIISDEFTDSLNILVQKKISEISSNKEDIEEALTELVYEIKTFDEPDLSYYTNEGIENLLKERLRDKAIDLPFIFHVSESIDSLASDRDESKELYVYKTRLYPDSYFGRDEILSVSFPSRREEIFRSLGLLFTGSLMFTLIILLTFGFTIKVILRQKKLSDIKSDFINNMTHEFKTPIATISLAVDSINNSKVIHEPEKIRGFTRVIEEENKRMNHRVEGVLQMSLMDKNDFSVFPRNTNVHELIQQLVDNMQLQAAKKGGSIKTELNATQSIINIDADHFGNVITNLLDNALKYTEQVPEILVKTESNHNQFQILVNDNGIGMSKEIQSKVFDRFYRAPTGNIHNVKGFGLGLAYVKEIIHAHGGSLQVKSQQGKGSTFIIIIPQENNG